MYKTKRNKFLVIPLPVELSEFEKEMKELRETDRVLERAINQPYDESRIFYMDPYESECSECTENCTEQQMPEVIIPRVDEFETILPPPDKFKTVRISEAENTVIEISPEPSTSNSQLMLNNEPEESGSNDKRVSFWAKKYEKDEQIIPKQSTSNNKVMLNKEPVASGSGSGLDDNFWVDEYDEWVKRMTTTVSFPIEPTRPKRRGILM